MLSVIPFGPTLPDQSLNREARDRALARAQDEYTWDWSWPPGCATARTLLRGDGYAPDYVAHIARLYFDISRNHTAMILDGIDRSTPLTPPASPDELAQRFFAAAEDFHASAPRVRPATADGYAGYFARLPTPPLVERARRDPAAADALFAWQRVAGANPMSLHRIAALPEGFALSEARWSAVVNAGTLAASLADGRVYAVDFTLLHGAPCTRYLGRQKYLCGARAVFTTRTGALRPVAIQLEPGGTVFTPKDGAAWAMAKYCVQVADANVHETMEHLGATHMVLEAVGVAARRQLADEHPLRKLVEVHFEGTLAINHSAKTSLIAPDGVIDRVFAARIDVAASLVRASLDRFVLQDRAPARELRARGVDDPSRLADFPYRDDVLAVYPAIERFAQAYVRFYYPDDAAVAADPELRAWVGEVGSPIGGALRGVRPVETRDALAEWMANVIHLASAQHAAVNFPQFPFFSWGASVGGACWGPPPDGSATDADLLALMPPWDCLILQADTVFQLSNVYYNRLGAYPMTFDPRLRAIMRQFELDLEAIDASIAAADAQRLLPYPFLRPSLTPASINI